MLVVVHAWDSCDWGDDYLSLVQGALITPWLPNEIVVDCPGWDYGLDLTSGRRGWYPPEFVQVHSPCPPTMPRAVLVVLHAFDPSGWGADYLCLEKGALLAPWLPDDYVDGQGWAYGLDLASGRSGWYPPEFARLSVGWVSIAE